MKQTKNSDTTCPMGAVLKNSDKRCPKDWTKVCAIRDNVVNCRE
jgi:hypothetical protein